ncbi:MAG TPA: hypothetical protein VHM70_18770 [Polyangiaceae bacterium]|jgi:hypothetical protein|nr:hypothetical protein [Polyangiaceae bacterium]
MARFIWLVFAIGVVGCGQDESLPGDTRRAPEAGARQDVFDFAKSRTLDALRDAKTRQALCGLLGVLAAAQAGGDPLVCQGIVDACSAGDGPPAADAGAPPAFISDDLSGLVGCAATATDVDGCVADLLNVARTSFADVTCSSSDLNVVPAAALLASASCGQLLLRCPKLFVPLVQVLSNPATQ